RLTSEFSFCTHLERHTRYFGSECVELIHHGVDRLLQFSDLTFHIHGDLLRKVTIRNCRCYFGDVTHLRGEVRGHLVHRISKVLPCTTDSLHLCLAAKLTFGSYFEGHTRYFGCE